MTEIRYLKNIDTMIKYEARKLTSDIDLRQDLEQEGRIGALQAFRRHDEIIYSPKAFAFWPVRGKMITYLTEKAYLIHISHRQYANGRRNAEVVSIEGYDFVLDHSMELEIQEEVCIDQIISSLTNAQMMLCYAIREGLSISDYAKATGMNRGSLYQLAKRIAKKIEPLLVA